MGSDIRKPIRTTSQISTNTFKFKMNFITLISVTLSCLVISSLSAPAPQPLIWPGLAAAGAGAVAFDLATGLSIAGLGAPTSLLVAKGLAAKKLVLLSALAASRNQRRNQRRNCEKVEKPHLNFIEAKKIFILF